jgi:hypothetical protein
MNVAVIGDYESQEYGILLEKVRISFPEERVIDLSRHKSNNWKKRDDDRIADIKDAHLVIICREWYDHIDVRHDISEAQKLKKEIAMEYNGGFIPFVNQGKR